MVEHWSSTNQISPSCCWHHHNFTNRLLGAAEALAPLTRLRELHADDCGLRSLSGLPALASLTLLRLGGNRLADANEIDRIACLTDLREVALAGNPLARRPVHRPLLVFKAPQIRVIDGQPVTEEERAYAQLLLAAPAAGGGGGGGVAGQGQAPLSDLLSPGGLALPAVAAAAGFGWSMPAVTGLKGAGFEALQQQLAAGGGGGALPFAAIGSVPSIQAGGFVLPGVNTLALSGTAIGCGPFVSNGLSSGGAAIAGPGSPARPGSAGGRRRAAAGGIGAIRLGGGMQQGNGAGGSGNEKAAVARRAATGAVGGAGPRRRFAA
jgi:hypothetical protein